MELTIREVGPADPIRAQLIEFEKAVIRASYTAFMAPELVELIATDKVVIPWLSTLHPDGAYLIAEAGAYIAGTIDVRQPNLLGQSIVEPLMVRTNRRREGVGTYLWNQAEDRAAGWGARNIGAWSIVANVAARSFYQARGCNPMSERDLVVGTTTFKCEFLAKQPRTQVKIATIELFRPVGPKELELISQLEFRAFPPRLEGQPIFYPVLTRSYATRIAAEWNVRSSGYGAVTAFDVRQDYLDRWEVHNVGGREHREYWIPAEGLDEFNANIVGSIRIVAEYGERPDATGLSQP